MAGSLHSIEGSIARRDRRRSRTPYPYVSDDSFNITLALQETLDIEQIIEIFHEHVETHVHHDALEYHNPDLGIDVKTGTPANHACTYHLNLGNKPMGQLVFKRRKRFTEEDHEQLENILSSLLYPLRNALQYNEALQLAQKDPLTGTFNRATLDDSIQREINTARRHNTPLSMIMLDIDHFKGINDNYGHSTGDQVLKSVANAAQECIRNTDMLFRYGGEEFLIVARNTDYEGCQQLAERIRQRIEQDKCVVAGNTINATASLGISTLRQEETQDSLFSRADRALYQAKNSGRNQVQGLE